MNKIMSKFSASLLLFLLVNNASAQIPVTDSAGLAQAVQMVTEAQKQYEQVRNNFEESMSAIEGNDWNYFASRINNDYDFIPIDDWQDIEDIDVTSLRQRYGLYSDDPDMQEMYDQRMRYLAANESAYSSQQQHLANIEELRNRADSVTTPQKREELANAISLEVAAMQSDQNRIETINQNMNRDAKLREMAANRELREMFEPVE